MKEIMISTFSGVFIAVISYGIYCYVRNNRFNELYSLENHVENTSIRNVEPSPNGGSLTIVIQK